MIRLRKCAQQINAHSEDARANSVAMEGKVRAKYGAGAEPGEKLTLKLKLWLKMALWLDLGLKIAWGRTWVQGCMLNLALQGYSHAHPRSER